MKSDLSRNACFAPLLLLGLVTMSTLSATLGGQSGTVSLGPQNGLVVSMEGRGAKMRISRQLPPPPTSPPPTTTPATTASSSSSSSSSRPPVSSSTSSASTVTPMQTTAEVNVSLIEVRELDANGAKIKLNDSFRSFSAFNDQNFSITPLPDNHAIPYSKIPSIGLEANTALPPPILGNVSIDACVAKDNGTVALGDETMTLVKGQLKVNLEVRRWEWAQSARYLEADFLIQVASGRIVKKVSEDQPYGFPERYSLGKDASANFSRKINVDSSWRNLTEGYPKLSTDGSKYVITVRIPRFNTSASYDVSFDPGYQPSDRGGGPVGCAEIILPQFYNFLLASLSLAVVKMIG